MPVLSPNDEDPFENLSPGYDGVGEFYDLFADNSDIPFFIECAKRAGSPVLDLAAGTGRITFALAQEGFEVVALEQSESMLAVAREKLESAPEEVCSRIELIKGTMSKFSLDRKFALTMVPNSFGHLMTREDQLSMLLCVKEHLTDEGIFVLDIFPGEHQYENAKFQDVPTALADGRIVTRFGVITSDFDKKIMRVELRYLVEDSEGVTIDEINVVSEAALIFNQDVESLIKESGLQIEEEYGDFERNSFTLDSGHRIFILRK